MSNLRKAIQYSIVCKDSKSHVLDRKYDLHEELEKSIAENTILYGVASFIATLLLAIAIVLL